MTKNMRFSTGNKIPENDNLIKDIPLVGEIDFKEFGILKESIAGKPLCCAHCGGIVTNIKDVKIDEKMGKYFNCKFCGSVIILDDTTFAESQENFEWIIPQENKEEMQIKKGNSLVGVLDVSGSMYGPRLEGVKQSLITTLRDYKMNQKQAIFSLVTFESAVRIHSLDGEAIVTIAGDNIYSKKDIEELVKKEP